MDFITTLDDLRSTWAVVSVVDSKNGDMLWIGLSPLVDAFALKKFRRLCRTRTWFDTETPVMVSIKHVGRAEQCEEKLAEYINGMPTVPPFCQYVRCVGESRVFNSPKEAAQAHNVNLSSLYNHLAGKPGYETIKGKTFMYGIR